MCPYSQITKNIIFPVSYRRFRSSWDKASLSHERSSQMAKWCFEIFREEVSQSPEQLS
jgi:hypothetical protein